MGTIIKSKEGTWRAQVRRKGKYASQTFRLKTQAQSWIRDTEQLIEIGGEPKRPKVFSANTIGALVDLYLDDLRDGRHASRFRQSSGRTER